MKRERNVDVAFRLRSSKKRNVWLWEKMFNGNDMSLEQEFVEY